MKFRSLGIQAFRGSTTVLELDIPSRGICVFGENGFGKSTICDAIEFLCHGTINEYRREGWDVGALRALKAGDLETKVGAVLDDGVRIKRVIRDGRAGAIVDPDGVELGDLPDIPALRHRTLTDFVLDTRGQRKAHLFDILGLADLEETRSAFVNARNKAKSELKTIAGSLDRARTSFQSALGDGDFASTVRQLTTAAGIRLSGVAEQDLVQLEIDSDQTAPTANPVSALANASAINQKLETEDAIAAWNETVKLSNARQAALLVNLLEDAQRVLDGWEPESCPLCEQDVTDFESFAARVSERKAEYEESSAALVKAQSAVESEGGDFRSLSESLRVLADDQRVPEGRRLELAVAADESLAISEHIKAQVAAREPVTLTRPGSLESPLLDSVSSAISDVGNSGEALAELVKLRALLIALNTQQALFETATRRLSILESAVANVTTAANEVLTSRIEELSEDVATYFGIMVGKRHYKNVRLEVLANGKGVDFVLEFADELQLKEVSPPHRVMSESQLTSLGLAMFLAEAKRRSGGWQTLVLDDVLNSHDATGKVQLAELLKEHFSDWQLIVLTHHRNFADRLAEIVGKGMNSISITGWTIEAGIAIGSGGAALDRLKAGLAEGKSSEDLKQHIQPAVEHALSEPLAGFRMNSRYTLKNDLSARDLLSGLREGFKKRRNNDDVMAALDRLEPALGIRNEASHEKVDYLALTTDDLNAVVAAIDRFKASISCAECNSTAWRKDASSCKCGKTTFAKKN